MTINEYFNLIQDKILNKDSNVLKIKSDPPNKLYVFIEAINYMMWEWCEDHYDTRIDIFDYIIIPNNVDFDFTSVSFEDFIKFLSDEKSKEIITIEI